MHGDGVNGSCYDDKGVIRCVPLAMSNAFGIMSPHQVTLINTLNGDGGRSSQVPPNWD